MKVFSFVPSEYFGSTTYVIQSCDEYAIIDPSVPVDHVLGEIPRFSPQYIIVTHTHFDHMLFLEAYSKRFPNAKVLVPQNDTVGLTDSF